MLEWCTVRRTCGRGSQTADACEESTAQSTAEITKQAILLMVEMALKEFLSVVVLLLLSSTAGSATSKKPLVIAHRGSSGVLPEHTIEAYKRAISDGADVIECDVTLSKDLVPVCLHEELLQRTTDVADRSEFADRNRSITAIEYGKQVLLAGWFAFDFTVEELQTLRKRQPFDFRDHTFDGLYTIPTLDEFIAVAKSASREVGIYPEIKNPEMINSHVLQNSSQRLEDIVLEVLERNGYRTSDDPCYLQCFDEQSLRYVKDKTQLRLVMLIEESVSDDKLAEWSQIFYGIGAWHNILGPHWTPEKGYKNWIGNKTTDFVARAHRHGLKVHVYTLRNEDRFLAWDFQQDFHFAFRFVEKQEVDGVFTDFPQTLSRHQRNVYGAAQRTANTVYWVFVVAAVSLVVIF